MYIEVKRKCRLAAIKKLLGNVHAELRKGTREQAREYCMKEDSRIDGPWEIGSFGHSQQGKRTDLDEACGVIKAGGSLGDVASQMPSVFVKYSRGLRELSGMLSVARDEKPEVMLLYGPSGCGKSMLARNTTDSYWVDPVGASGWFDGYDNQTRAIFDDFDGAAGRYMLKDWLKITDRYRFRVPIKGGFVWWNPKEIFVTSNIHPSKWWSYIGREAQYKAVERRFTRIIHWRNNEEDPIVIDRDGRPELWSLWWHGPSDTPTGPTVEGPLDLWVERNAPSDQFDFIDREDVMESEPSDASYYSF